MNFKLNITSPEQLDAELDLAKKADDFMSDVLSIGYTRGGGDQPLLSSYKPAEVLLRYADVPPHTSPLLVGVLKSLTSDVGQILAVAPYDVCWRLLQDNVATSTMIAIVQWNSQFSDAACRVFKLTHDDYASDSVGTYTWVVLAVVLQQQSHHERLAQLIAAVFIGMRDFDTFDDFKRTLTGDPAGHAAKIDEFVRSMVREPVKFLSPPDKYELTVIGGLTAIEVEASMEYWLDMCTPDNFVLWHYAFECLRVAVKRTDTNMDLRRRVLSVLAGMAKQFA